MTTPDPTAIRAFNARLLRRLVLSPSPELVESFDSATPREMVTEVIARPDIEPAIPSVANDDLWEPTRWWLTVMARDDAGFHERMVWFWHGLVTSSVEKANGQPILDQHQILRTYALGDFRELLREITLDPAMLYWLDGRGSQADAPNENYARELMELFALGRHSGAYTEADIRAGAKALAGYWIDTENGDSVEFDPDWALNRSVNFLGRQVRDVDDVIDAVCDHEACPRHVSERMYDHFVGGPIDPAHHDRLAAVYRDSGLAAAPLAQAILTDESFLSGPEPRPRSALEWFLGVRRLMRDEIDVWPLQQLGQTPLHPPNVAGWPGTDRWLSSGLALTKGQHALDTSWDTETLDEGDPITDLLRRSVLYEVSPATRTTLDDIVAGVDGPGQRSTLLHAAIAMCPEFSFA